LNIPLLLILASFPVLLTGGALGYPNVILAAGALFLLGAAMGVYEFFLYFVLGIRKKTDIDD